MRSLAQRVSVAAKEIKQLINASAQEFNTGGILITHAGKTMEDVVASIHSVTATMAEIRAAAREQSFAIEQVNQAVLEIEAVTQQNTSMVDEASATSATLSEQVHRLVSLVEIFRLTS